MLFSGGLCAMHHWRRRRNNYTGDLNTAKTPRTKGTGSIGTGGYVSKYFDGQRMHEHIFLAEKALGRKLPEGAHVHHVDENPSNNNPSNLVVCQNAEYHKILHIRTKALEECGNANYRKCYICKEYDDPKNLYVGKKSVKHNECYNAFRKTKGY